MTYSQLLEQLKSLSPEQLKLDVTVLATETDELYGLREDYPLVFSTEEDDRLDANHPYIVI